MNECVHPAGALIVTMVGFTRDMRRVWTSPFKSITLPGKMHMLVDTRCAMCGETVKLEGDYDVPGEDSVGLPLLK
jgi:hypothetical protein